MTVARLVLVLLLALLIVVVTGLGYLHFANLNQYRDQIASWLTTLVGRDVTISDVDVDLWPAISITTNVITVANASWGSQPYMAEIGHLSASVSPLSLLLGPLFIQDFTLEDVSLLLESDEDGKSNWDLANLHDEARFIDEQESDQDTEGLPMMLGKVRVSNVLLTRRQSGTPDRQFQLEKLTIKPNDADQLDVITTGKILDLPLAITGQIGTRQQLEEYGYGEFILTGSFSDLQLKMSGQLAITDPQGSTRIETLFSSNNVATFIKAAGLSVPLSGPLRVKSDIASKAESLNIKIDGSLDKFNTLLTMDMQHDEINIDGKLKHADALGLMLGVSDLPKDEIAIKGSLTKSDQAVKLHEITVSTGKTHITASGRVATGDDATSLQITAKGDSLMDLMTNLPPLAFDGSADLSLFSNGVKIDPLKLDFGASDIDGSLEVTDIGSMKIKTDLVSKTLDLTEFTANEKEDSDQQASTLDGSEQTANTNTKFVFTNETLPFDRLRQTEMDIKLSVDKLATTAMTLNSVKANGSLHKGILQANVGFRTITGGHSENSFILDASSEQADLQANMDARNIQMKILSGKVKETRDIPVTDFSAELKSKGNSPHILAANSNGRVILITRDGLIDNTIITNISGDILAQLLMALNPFAKQEPHSNLDCGIVALNIQNGTSTIETFLVQDDKIMIVAGGDIDLKTEKIDIEFNTKPREGMGISADMFVTPFVALGGTLIDPGIRVKKTGTLFTLGTALATGGLSLAVQGGIDRITGEVDQCSVILPKYPLPSLAD